MYLKEIQTHNFKNFEQIKLSFSKKVICLAGKNGIGKTNLLDAIHYSCLTKSYFNNIDYQNILFEKDFFTITCQFENEEDKIKTFCGVQKKQAKIFKTNDITYEKLAEHIGKIPLVMISPSDNLLILEGSEIRRKFIDNMISQVDGEYLRALMKYNRLLNQRNSLLKNYAQTFYLDEILIETLNEQIVPLGKIIYEKRKELLKNFKPFFERHYKKISKGKEKPSIKYNSQLNKTNYEKLLNESLENDKKLARTTHGIHKDELDFRLDKKQVKKFASQGQQKSFLIALKLAQYDFILKQLKKKPILLLDDIFEKLDQQRFNQLMLLVSQKRFGQIFMTDTQKSRIKIILKKLKINFEIIDLEKMSKAK